MNNEGFSQTVRDLPRAWQSLGRTRQMIAGGVVVAVVIGIVAALFYMQRPQQSTLYAGLNDSDAAAIVAKLKDMKVPYTVADGGSSIKVPEANAGDIRLQLAGAGLPNGSGSVVGMELFDKTNLGITDFAQKLNYQRALEGELTKTISRLSQVESARVHLVLPQERLFTSQQQDTTASVVLKLKPGARLTDDQVSSVRTLVARSVEGLKAQNVAVVDVNGNALGRLDTAQAQSNEQAANHLEVQRQRESELENKIQGMLSQVLGANHAVVRANVELDWSEVKQNIEDYTAGQSVSRKDTREQFSGQGADVAAPGGVPGTQSNIPNYQAIAGATNGNSSYTRSDQTENFQPGKNTQSITRAPGDVKKVSVAVMVDQKVQSAQVDSITQVVTAAAGIQPQRGDQVSVVTLPFDSTLSEQLRQQQEQQTAMDYVSLGFRLAGVLVGLGGLFLLFRMMSNAVKPRQVPVVVAESLALPGGTAGLLPPVKVQERLTEALQASRSREEIEAQIRDELRAEIRGELEAQFSTEIEQRRHEEEQRRQEDELRQRDEEVQRAALAAQETAKEMAARREQMREAVMKLATNKPETLADVLNQWLEQSRTAAAATNAPVRRATSALN